MTAVEAVLAVLDGTRKPFIYTSGISLYGDTGESPVDENTPLNPPPFTAWRAEHERHVLRASRRGIRSITIRPSLVYGRNGGTIAQLIAEAQRAGTARYINTGTNRWSTVHVEDLAALYVQAIEQAEAGSVFNGAAGDPIILRTLAEAISRLPGINGKTASWSVEEAKTFFGPFASIIALNQHVSGVRAMKQLVWKPKGLSLLESLTYGTYSQGLDAF